MAYIMYHETEPDAERRGCPDCRHCIGYVTWWCTNKDAIAVRGSNTPNVHSCDFWEPGLRMPSAPQGSGWWKRLTVAIKRRMIRADLWAIVKD